MTACEDQPGNLNLNELLNRGYKVRTNTQFKLEYKDIHTERFGTLNLIASFPVFLSPEFYAPVDEDKISACADSVLDFYLSHGFQFLQKDSSKLQKLKKSAYFVARSLYPTVSKEVFESELMKLNVVLVVASVHIDDLLEVDEGFSNLGLGDGLKFINLLVDYFRQEKSRPLESATKLIVPFLTVGKSALNRTQELCPAFNRTKEHFFRTLTDSLLAMSLLQRAELNKSVGYRNALSKLLHFKDASIAVHLEALMFVLGIEVPEEIRSTVLFREAINKLDAMGRTTNDIFSFGKEIRQSQFRSPVLSRVVNGTMSLAVSFQHAVKDAVDTIEDLLEIGRILLNLYPEQTDLHRFLLLMGQQIDVFGHLGIFRDRYLDVQTSLET